MTGGPYFEDINRALLRVWGGRSGLKVLDVGCGAATTTHFIAELGNEVTGIERHAGSAATARGRLARVIERDLHDVEAIRQELGGERFDVLIFADVLEHLPDSLNMLRAYLSFARPGAAVIISLPNVALWSVRLQLLLGLFRYEESGVLDRTHLRFFTRRSARQLLRDAGCEPVRVVFNPGLLRPFVPLFKKVMLRSESAAAGDPRALLESAPYRAYFRWIYPLESGVARLWPTLLGWQMVFEARLR